MANAYIIFSLLLFIGSFIFYNNIFNKIYITMDA